MMYILSYLAYSLIYHITLHQLYANRLCRPVNVALRVRVPDSRFIHPPICIPLVN
jgi:hypothetical protein